MRVCFDAWGFVTQPLGQAPRAVLLPGCVYVITCFVTVTRWDTAAGTSVRRVLMKGWEPMFPRVAFAHRKVTLMSCWAVMCVFWGWVPCVYVCVCVGWVKENIWLLKGSHTCWPVNHVALGCRRSVSHLSHGGFGKGVCVCVCESDIFASLRLMWLQFCRSVYFQHCRSSGYLLSGDTFQQRSALLFLTDTRGGFTFLVTSAMKEIRAWNKCILQNLVGKRFELH